MGECPTTKTQNSLQNTPSVPNKSGAQESPHSDGCMGFPSTINGEYVHGFSSCGGEETDAQW